MFSLALSIQSSSSAFSFFLTFSASINLGETVTYCGLKGVFLYESIPLQVGGLDMMDTSHMFPQCVLAAITLVGGVVVDGGARS